MRSSFSANSKEPVTHFHPKQSEQFFVVQGQLRVRIHNSVVNYNAGECFTIPAGTPHSMWNASSKPTNVCWTVTPGLRTHEFLTTAFTLAEQKSGLLPLLKLLIKHRSEFRIAMGLLLRTRLQKLLCCLG